MKKSRKENNKDNFKKKILFLFSFLAIISRRKDNIKVTEVLPREGSTS